MNIEKAEKRHAAIVTELYHRGMGEYEMPESSEDLRIELLDLFKQVRNFHGGEHSGESVFLSL